MGPLLKVARAVPPLRAVGHGGRGTPAVRGQPDRRPGNLGVSRHRRGRTLRALPPDEQWRVGRHLTLGGRSRPILRGWYRAPPAVTVGRPPFDPEVRQRLETQHPDIKFDWRAITSAQPPPPDAEHWRERRRAEKAAKLARLD